MRQRLIELLREKSLRIGNFTLVSGQKSNYYFDAKPTTLDPEGAYLCSKLILDAIRLQGVEADAIGGLALGAAPIVAAVAAVSFAERDRYRPLGAFIARKEAKGHGTQKRIEGFSGPPGTRVVVVDDVCTTGGSTLSAVQSAEEAGYRVEAVFCLVDREQGGSELLAAYPFFALIKASELLDDPEIQKQMDAARLSAAEGLD